MAHLPPQPYLRFSLYEGKWLFASSQRSYPHLGKKKKFLIPQARSFHGNSLVVCFFFFLTRFYGNWASGLMEVTGGVEDSEGPFWDIEGIKGERISGFLPNSCIFQWNPNLCVFKNLITIMHPSLILLGSWRPTSHDLNTWICIACRFNHTIGLSSRSIFSEIITSGWLF